MKKLKIDVDNRCGVSFDAKLKEVVINAIENALMYINIEFPVEISISLVTPTEMRELNKAYRGVDRETDVLSFPMYNLPTDMLEIEKSKQRILLGDIIISLDSAMAQSIEYGHSYEREIYYLTIHSTLHLLGYDHIKEDEKKEMRKIEKEIIRRTKYCNEKDN